MSIYILLLTVSTIAGAIAGLILRAALIRRLPRMLQRSAERFASSVFQAGSAGPALADKSSFDSIRPLIETHVDEFLGHRLGKEMPMIGMFIGDKTIAQLKSIFMKELEEIFPLVMNQYMGNLAGGTQSTAVLPEKISRLSAELASSVGQNELLLAPAYGALAGLATGILQIIAILALT